jgi:sulfite exporter TauE/SafE/copper chaperone CopZ
LVSEIETIVSANHIYGFSSALLQVHMIIKLKTSGMECRSCEQRITAAVKELPGIKRVDSDYTNEITTIEYKEDLISENEIRKKINALGFGSGKPDIPVSERFGNLAIALGVFAILIGLYLVFGESINFDFNISQETGFVALFILGFLTGFHCIGMCGGFVLSYAKNIKKAGDIFPHVQYGAGKTISYTVIGAVFGLVGSFIAFTIELRAGVAILAGVFLVVYGLNMLNIFPILRRLQLRIPSLIPMGERKQSGPLYTGLLNGLMIACGPLQALYIFAAGTGSPIAGAQALFFFGLGTLAPLLTFGIASNFLSQTLSHNVVRFSGVLVIGLGLMMANNGVNLLGISIFTDNAAASIKSRDDINITMEDGYQVIEMNVTRYGWEPNSFILKKGVPVKWKLDGKEINGCNNEIIVREYGLTIPIKEGMQTVEFTPDKEGVVKWSCWMGMIPGQFIVVADSNNFSQDTIAELPSGSSCDGSCGGCGCGCGG